MTIIATTTKSTVGAFAVPKTVLTGNDTFTYNSATSQELILYNITAAAVVVTLTGAAGTPVVVPLSGGSTFSVSGGIAITVPANNFEVVVLPTVDVFLKGVITVSGGVGVVAAIIV
jgi:hypothetical protein